MDWFAGHKGDAGDQGINYAAGFADNVTLNASWLWRNQLGTDTVDYDGTAYSAGGWTGFVVQLPGGIKSVASGVNGLRTAASQFDEAGKCANMLTKLWNGGCFVAGTLVTVSELPWNANRQAAIWSNEDWREEFDSASDWETKHSTQTVTPTSNRLLIPMEQVPLGTRVPANVPKAALWTPS